MKLLHGMALTATVGCVVAFALSSRRSSPDLPKRQSPAQLKHEMPALPPRVRSDASTIVVEDFSYWTTEDAQLFNFLPGSTDLQLDNLSSDPSAVMSFYYSAAFGIEQVIAVKQNEFYLLGESAAGEQIVQRWTHKKVKKLKLNGNPVHKMVRVDVYRGFGLGLIEQVSPDPYGRFVLLVHSDVNGRHLSQLSLDPSHNVVRLLDGSQLDWLQKPGPRLLLRRHVSEGLLWQMQLQGVPYGDMTLLIGDVNDDGVFDDLTMLDNATARVAYPFEFPSPGVWVEDFVHYL